MKYIITTILYISIIPLIFSDNNKNVDSQRLYCVKIISFHRIYELYFTQTPIGYYKYFAELDKNKIFLTFEGSDFLQKCKFDENFSVISNFIPMNIYTNTRGKMFRIKKKFNPIIEENRKIKKYPYGYGKN